MLNRFTWVVAATCLAFAGCNSSSEDTHWQDVVDRVAAIRPTDYPAHLFTGDTATRTGDEFDVNLYFTVLTHISMEPGYVLDWVYHRDNLGAYPVRYARRESDPPFRTQEELMQAGGHAAWDYEEHVQAEDSEDGFFERVVLDIMGGQFYLWWHAAYNDTRIVASRSELEDVLERGTCEPVELDLKREARRLDLEPDIELRRDDVSVAIIVFGKWSGFSRDVTVFERAFPHRVLDHSRDVQVRFPCGLMFDPARADGVRSSLLPL